MARQKILVPYNFTSQDRKAVDFVLRTYSLQPEAEVILFHAFTPVPEFEMREARVMEKLKSNLSYLNSQAAERNKALKELQQELQQEGFGEDRVKLSNRPRKKDIAAEIVEYANQENCAVIVISHKPGKTKRFFTGNVYTKVIAGVSDATVCIVT